MAKSEAFTNTTPNKKKNTQFVSLSGMETQVKRVFFKSAPTLLDQATKNYSVFFFKPKEWKNRNILLGKELRGMESCHRWSSSVSLSRESITFVFLDGEIGRKRRTSPQDWKLHTDSAQARLAGEIAAPSELRPLPPDWSEHRGKVTHTGWQNNFRYVFSK